jgi:hypothetical protein
MDTDKQKAEIEARSRAQCENRNHYQVMPPRRGLIILWMMFYRDAAPTVLTAQKWERVEVLADGHQCLP